MEPTKDHLYDTWMYVPMDSSKPGKSLFKGEISEVKRYLKTVIAIALTLCLCLQVCAVPSFAQEAAPSTATVVKLQTEYTDNPLSLIHI